MAVKGIRVVRWTGGTALTGLLAYLLLAGAITIQTSGDVECPVNPCVSYINVSCAKTFRVYGSSGARLDFVPELERFLLEDVRTGREVNLNNFSCKRGVKHQWRLLAWKKQPWSDVKWGIGVGATYLDPVWSGIKPEKVSRLESVRWSGGTENEFFLNLTATINSGTLRGYSSPAVGFSPGWVTLLIQKWRAENETAQIIDSCTDITKSVLEGIGANQTMRSWTEPFCTTHEIVVFKNTSYWEPITFPIELPARFKVVHNWPAGFESRRDWKVNLTTPFGTYFAPWQWDNTSYTFRRNGSAACNYTGRGCLMGYINASKFRNATQILANYSDLVISDGFNGVYSRYVANANDSGSGGWFRLNMSASGTWTGNGSAYYNGTPVDNDKTTVFANFTLFGDGGDLNDTAPSGNTFGSQGTPTIMLGNDGTCTFGRCWNLTNGANITSTSFKMNASQWTFGIRMSRFAQGQNAYLSAGICSWSQSQGLFVWSTSGSNFLVSLTGGRTTLCSLTGPSLNVPFTLLLTQDGGGTTCFLNGVNASFSATITGWTGFDGFNINKGGEPTNPPANNLQGCEGWGAYTGGTEMVDLLFITNTSLGKEGNAIFENSPINWTSEEAQFGVAVVANSPPTINLLSPATNTKFTTGFVNVTFNATDADNTSLDFSLVRNGTYLFNLSLISIGVPVLNFSVQSWPVGNWSIYVNGSDRISSNVSSTSNIIVVPANTAPTVNLLAPLDANVSNTATIVNYSAAISDDENATLQWCAARLNTTIILNNITSVASPGSFNVSTNRTEGNYSWNIICSDGLAEASGSARAIKIVPTNAAPSVTLSSPADASVFSVGFINFTYTPTDLTNATLDCTLLRNTTNVSYLSGVSQQLSNFSVATTAAGNYSWNVTCFDGLLSGTSSVRTFKVVPANTAPVVTLLSPISGAKFSNGTALNFSFNVTDQDNATLSWCAVTRNLTTIMGNLSSVSLGRLNVSIPSLAVGNYSWNASCSDGLLEGSGIPISFSVVKNNTAPVVTLVSPVNFSNVSSRTAINFTFNVTDDENASLTVSLVLNQTLRLNLSDFTINVRMSNVTQNFSGLGRYFWTVNASDGALSAKGANWTFLLTDQFSFNVSKQANFKFNLTNTSTLIAPWGQNGSLGGFNITNRGSFTSLWMKITWRNTTTTRILDSYFDSNWSVNRANYSSLKTLLPTEEFEPVNGWNWTSTDTGVYDVQYSCNGCNVSENNVLRFIGVAGSTPKTSTNFSAMSGMTLDNFTVTFYFVVNNFANSTSTGRHYLLWFARNDTTPSDTTTGYVALGVVLGEFQTFSDGLTSGGASGTYYIRDRRYFANITRTHNGTVGTFSTKVYVANMSNSTHELLLTSTVSNASADSYSIVGMGSQGSGYSVNGWMDAINFTQINGSTTSLPTNYSVMCSQLVSEQGGNVSAPHGSRMGRLDYHFNSTQKSYFTKRLPITVFNNTFATSHNYTVNDTSTNFSDEIAVSRTCPGTNNVTFPLFGSNYSAGGINLSQGYTTIGLSVRGNESLTDNVTLLLNGTSICKSVRPADYSGWFNLSCTVPNSTYLYKVGIGIVQTNFSINHSKYGVPYSVYVDWLRVWNTSDPSTYAQFRIATNGSLTGTHTILTGTEANITSVNASASKFLWYWINSTSWRPVLFDLLWRID